MTSRGSRDGNTSSAAPLGNSPDRRAEDAHNHRLGCAITEHGTGDPSQLQLNADTSAAPADRARPSNAGANDLARKPGRRQQRDDDPEAPDSNLAVDGGSGSVELTPDPNSSGGHGRGRTRRTARGIICKSADRSPQSGRLDGVS